MRSSTRTRSFLGYVALLGGFVASLWLCLYASSTVRDLRLYRMFNPRQDIYVFSYRAGAPGPEMNFHQLLSLHIFLQWFGFALMFVFSGWIIRKVRRATQEKIAL